MTQPKATDFWDQPWPVQLMGGLILIIAAIGMAGACGIIVGTFVRGYRLVAG